MKETPPPPEGYEITFPEYGVSTQDWKCLVSIGSHMAPVWVDTSEAEKYRYPPLLFCRPVTKSTAPTPPEGYMLFAEEYKWQKLPKGSLMSVRGEWVSLHVHPLAAIPGSSAFYALPDGAVVEESEVADLKLPQESVLQEAERLVNGDRQASYGSATESFERIAGFWHTYLKNKLKDTDCITAKDVASMMILMKVSRSVTSSKRDNWVDIAGYAELGSQLEEQD